MPSGHVYKGGGGDRRRRRARQGRSPTWTPSPSRIRPPPLSFPPPERIGRRGRGKGKGGAAPSSLSYSDSLGGGRAAIPTGFPLSPLGPCWPNNSPGGSDNLPVLQNLSETTRTIPVSECNLPIYESLPLNHFETPRHVRDLIRDSEQPLVIKSHNS